MVLRARAFDGSLAAFQREAATFVRSPLPFLLAAVFTVTAAALTFQFGNFFARNEADLRPFFIGHPYLYLLLLPALTAGLFADERKTGTIELQLSLPLGDAAPVVAKFLAAWATSGAALLCTLPMWITVSVLGNPDHGLILSGYVGSFLLAGLFCAIGTCMSAACERQTSAYVLGVVPCALLLLPGLLASALPGLEPVSAADAFDRFVLGAPDAAALFYFVFGMLVWLFAGVLCLHDVRRGSIPRQRVLTYGLLAVIWVSGNTTASIVLRPWRVDMTAEQRHTPTEGTLRLLSRLEEPVTLRLYVSQQALENLPGVHGYSDRVVAFLQTLTQASRGMLRLSVVRADPFSEEEEAAAAAGMLPLTLPDGGTGFFGLAAENATDGRNVLPFLAPERESFLEYDVARMIDALQQVGRPRVGLISGLPLATGPGGVSAALEHREKPYALYRELAARVDLVPLPDDLKDTDLSGLQAVVAVHPRPLSTVSAYVLEQYALRGGKVLAFVDPLSEFVVDVDPYSAPPATSSDLNALAGICGARMRPATVVLDPLRARPVTAPGRSTPLPYAAWPAFSGDDLNRSVPITANIGSLGTGSPGVIEPLPEATASGAVSGGGACTLTPLVRSSPQAGTVTLNDMLASDPAHLPPFSAAGPLTIAARLSGPCASRFTAPPDGTPARIGYTAAGTCNMIFVADADIWDDRFWLATRDEGGRTVGVPFAGNADFVLNAVDSLIGSSDLLMVRGRGTAARPLLVPQEIRREAALKVQAEERALQEKIAEARKRLQAEQGDAALRRELAQSQAALREIRRELNTRLEELQWRIQVINMTAIPLPAAVIAFLAAAARARRRRHEGA